MIHFVGVSVGLWLYARPRIVAVYGECAQCSMHIWLCIRIATINNYVTLWFLGNAKKNPHTETVRTSCAINASCVTSLSIGIHTKLIHRISLSIFIFYLFELLPSKDISMLNVGFISLTQTQNSEAIFEAAVTMHDGDNFGSSFFLCRTEIRYDTPYAYLRYMQVTHIVDTHTAYGINTRAQMKWPVQLTKRFNSTISIRPY